MTLPFMVKDMDKILDVIEKAGKLVEPDQKTVKKAKNAEMEIEKRLKNLLVDYPEVEFRFLGSYARNTWLPESLEIDVFLLFPESYSLEELERIALDIGKKAVDEYELRYASHPYVHGTVNGVEVDIVPCYKLSKIGKIKSAVDRTPFHHEWLKDRIKGKEKDVRLLKRFMKVINVYGAEYKIKGFSGYLCELLVIHYGSFFNLVNEASKWRRNLVIDPNKGKAYVKKGLEKFHVIDPVDEKRNVAANLSVDNLARFVEACRVFLRNPSLDFFIEKPPMVNKEKLNRELEKRFVYCVVFEKPPIIEDNLYSQLERAEKRISKILEDKEFVVLRSGHYAGEKCFLIFELLSGRLSAVKKHYGPKFENYSHSMKFIEKNIEYSRFFENGRYVTYKVRKFTEAKSLIESAIKNEHRSMGKDISEFIRNGKVIESDRISEYEELLPYLMDFLGVIV